MNHILIIMQREFLQRVRKRNFIVITLLVPLLMSSLFIIPTVIMSSSGEHKKIVVIDESGKISGQMQNSQTIEYIATKQTLAQAQKDTKYADAMGFLVINKEVETRPQLSLQAKDVSTYETEMLIKQEVSRVVEVNKLKEMNLDSISNIIQNLKTPVELKSYQNDANGNVKESSSIASFGIAYLFGFLIYMFIFLYGNMVMQGVIEEKSNRIIEVMVSSVRPFHLMLGKIFGIASVALVQFMIWVILTAIAVLSFQAFAHVEVTQVSELSGVLKSVTSASYLAPLLVYFVLFFIGGYLLYASLFAAVGSAVENPAEVQQLQMPITIPLIIAIMVMLSAVKDPNGSIAFWFSMIPFTSPVVMIARIPYGIPLWQILTSIALLYATFIGTTWFAAKIYRVGIFMYGKKPSLKELIKWFRYKI